MNPTEMKVTEPRCHAEASTSVEYDGSDAMEFVLSVGFFFAAAIAVAAGLARGETPGQRARVKDVATIEGIRDNQLVGYGLVVGLRGTGDSSQTVFPAQTLISALERMGVTVPQTGSNSASNMQVKNMAAVFVVATLPPFSRPGYELTSRYRRLAMRARSKAEFC